MEYMKGGFDTALEVWAIQVMADSVPNINNFLVQYAKDGGKTMRALNVSDFIAVTTSGPIVQVTYEKIVGMKT